MSVVAFSFFFLPLARSMGDYISTKRPSLLARFLGFLGIIMVPIKVNCWYCNQDSYLLPGGNQMERNWYCHFCENTNLRDESGDIVDPPPVINEGRISPITPMRDTSQTFQKATLCDNCQQNQMIIYILMSDYIKDEKDPNYEYYVKTADQHKAELHKKYPLCDNCQAKVDEFAASQKEALRLQRFRQKLARSSSTKTPIKPSTFAYTLRGTVWVLLHLSTVCFILYASIYPPLQPSLAEVLEEFKKLWDVCIAGVSSFATYQQIGLSPVIIRHVLDNTRDTCWYLTTTYLRTMKQSTMCLYGYNIGIHDNETCGWSLARYIVPLTIMAVCSFIWMDWHPFVSKTYFEEDRIQRWKLYKAIQRFFYLLRFGILLLLATSDQDKIHYILKPILFGYPIILISSFFVVKIPYSSRPARKVGNAVTLTGIKRTFSQIQLLAADTFEKVSEEALNAARYNRKPKESSSTSFDEQFMQTDSESASPAPPTPATPQRVGSMDTMAFSVKSDIIGGGMHQGGQSMLSARDDDLDTIVAGVHRIKFNGSL